MSEEQQQLDKIYVDKRALALQKRPWNRLLALMTRIIVWGVLLTLVYILRSFFLLVFLTFVFSYIQANGVNRLSIYIQNRNLRVILIAILFLSILIALSLFLAPRVAKQATIFANQFSMYIYKIDQGLLHLSNQHPLLNEVIPNINELRQRPPHSVSPQEWNYLKQSPTIRIMGLGEEETGKINVEQLLHSLANVGAHIVSLSATFLLALLFSFLIVLDLPQLGASVAELKYTKLRFIYVEVADSIRDFSHVLGQALEAQFFIAVVNTVLTAIGVYLLGLGQHVAFLIVIVFLCSFIPVIGVIISSIPICFLALQAAGFETMLLAVILIAGIHLIESYILNPKIYGYRLRINPVIVLIILTIGGQLFHFWGLILGVPICIYIFNYAIRIKKRPQLKTPLTR